MPHLFADREYVWLLFFYQNRHIAVILRRLIPKLADLGSPRRSVTKTVRQDCLLAISASVLHKLLNLVNNYS